jgi:hypothetical protein
LATTSKFFSLGSVLGLLLGNDNRQVVLLGSGTTMGWHFLCGLFRGWK